MKKKRLYTVLLILFICGSCSMAQEKALSKAHHVVIKTNLAGITLWNLNLAGELNLNPVESVYPLTLHVPVSYNPFSYGHDAKLKHIAIQPELRLWKGAAFSKFFIGLHAHYAYYNAGGISNINKRIKENRYQGNLFGMGASGGYKYMINDKIGIESVLGLGYAVVNHDIYDCQHCGSKKGEETKILFVPTKFAISLVYRIK
ncbi:DUF3575 domain-containing protein [Pedobacter sp. N36a]|uniref:DUF3575 domain-containing protein n=1 Tax=Pedobacter sp. N36a TaxID=2767996 RepID=UPI001656A74E|nr:DUF3575 domain-containing protein [Pedobacter sp. N36a]MBC8986320.1 DUF3575 domain-containing protein [Pedobacter sp. N36a]